MEVEIRERVERLNSLLKDTEFKVSYTEKVCNNIVKSGLMIQKGHEKNGALPALYYDEDWYSKTDSEVIEILVSAYNKADIEDMNKVFTKEFLYARVQPMILDKSNLESIKSSDFLYIKNDSFIILFYLDVYRHGNQILFDSPSDDIKSDGIIRLTKSFLETEDITIEELYRAAFENLGKVITVKNMYDVLNDLSPFQIPEDKENKMYVVSIKSCDNGAAAILHPKTYEILTEILGTPFLVLPSSIHECIAIPWNDDYSEFKEMVQEVNQSLNVEEILSDHVYRYDDTGLKILL